MINGKDINMPDVPHQFHEEKCPALVLLESM